MSNSLLTINMITGKAIELFKNTNSFIQNIDTQYDDQFARDGAKIGQSIRIRLPNDYTVRSGPAAQVQDTAEQYTTLTLTNQFGVDVSFNTVDRTMSMDDYSERVLAPMVNNLAGAVANNVMLGVDLGGCANLVANQDSSNNLLSPVLSTFLQAGAVLDLNSAPTMRRKMIEDPVTMARTVGLLSGLLNPDSSISKQYKTGKMSDAIDFEWFKDQTVIKHTTGSFTAGTVYGSGQSGSTLVTNAISGTLNAGDIITIALVDAVNRVTKQTTGQLRQFVVTANVSSGATSIPIYPAIVAPVLQNGTLVPVQYQTVSVAPLNGATISMVLLPNITYRKNLAFPPEAITLGTADLVMPTKGVEESARANLDGLNMRMLTAYVVGTDQLVTRLDILFGSLYIRPEWACAVADIL